MSERLRELPGWAHGERMRFIAVGIYNTAFGYACFAALYLAVGRAVPLFVVQVLAHVLSVANAFVAHRRFTFRSRSEWLPEFLRFNVSYLGALGFGLVALPLLVGRARMPPLVAAALVTVATVAVSYVLHRRFSFRRRP
jgi:putative flippase GtrA